MSGKAPPTGPRALLGKQGQQPHLSPQPGHANTRQSQLANGGGNGGPSSGLGSSSSPSSMNSRFGAAPPTGPRSLSVNGLPRGGKSKIFVNGHVGGRERDREREGSSNWPGKGQNRYGNTSPNPNGNTLTPGKFSISIPTKKPESSVLPRSSIQLRGEAFQVQPAKASPPQPSDEPPPPPPPDRSPPPIPPAGSPPPPPSLPPPPPTNSPPPPPQSPPPPPPPSLPPPPTPTEISMSVPTGPRLLSAPAPTKNLASHNAISIALPTSRVTNPAATPTPAQIQMQPAKPASPSSPKPQSLPSIPHWPPSRHHFPSDVRSHRVIYDPAVPLLPVHEHGSKDLKEKEKDARLDRDRAIDRTALISGYMKLGVHSQKPDPPSSDDLDFVAIMDIDSSKGEGTSTGAGTLAGALYGRSYRGGKEKSSGSEYFDGLIAAIRRKNHLGDDVSLPYPRIQGKGKGKESITRYDGEVLAGGDWFWVPEGDVQGGLASTLTKSSSPSAPTTSPSLPVPLESVSSSASAFLAKFSSGTAGVGVVAPADSLSHLLGHGNEERGYWICERAPVPRDPRMVRDRDKAGEGHNGSAELYLKERENRTRTQFYALDNYEYDPQTSTAPPPPTRLVITNISLLTPSAVLRAHFSQYGNIMSFEPQIDKQNGSPLGIVSIRFYNHSEAKKCLEKENGQKRPWAGAGYGPNGVGSIHGLGGKGDGGDQIQVEFDGNGDILATLMKELDDRKYGRKKKEVPPTPTIATANGSGGSGGGGGGGGGSIRIPADHSSFTPTQTQAPSFKLPPGLPPRPPSGPPTSIPLHSSASGGVSPAVSRPGLPLLHPSLPMRPPVDSREGRDRDRDRDRLLATPASSGPTIYGGSTPRPNGIVTPSSSAAGPSASLPSSLPVNPSIPNKPSEFTIANAKVKMRQAPLALLKARASVKKDLVRKQEGDDDLGASGIGNGTPVQIRLERQAAEKEKAKEKEWGRSRDKEWDRGRDRGREYDSGRRRSVSKERDRFHDRPLGPWHNSASASPLRESSRRDWDIRERRGRDRDRNNSQSRSRSRSSYDDNRTYIPSRSTYAGGKSSYHGGRRHSPSYQRRDGHRYNRARMSRSPSPGFRPHMRSSWQRDHDEVIAELRKSELDHLKLEPDSGGQFPEQVQEDDVKALLMQFNADKIFKSSQGIFATFSVDAARRAAYYINANMDLKLGYLKVKATPCAPPSLIKTTWDDEEMVSKAQEILTEELKRALQQDILSRFIGPQLKSIIHQHQNESTDIGSISVVDQINTRQQGLVGLSFRKQRKDKKLVKEDLAPEVDELLEEEEPRPKKKRKKERVLPPKKQRKQVVEEEEEEDQLESEVEDITIPTDERIKKRPLEVESELSEDEEPAQKRSKVEDIKRKRVAKKKDAKQSLDDEEIDIVPPVQDRLTPGIDSSLSPSRSLSPVVGRTLTTPPPPPPPPNPTDDVCDDDEDFYYAKLVLSGRVPAEETTPEPSEDSAESGKPVIRKHITGSARTEGFYKITHAEKATYVTQYQMRSTNKAAAAAQEVVEETVPQHITSSRSNRANARRRAQGLEEINQVQRAVALSKGEAANELSFKFNQLQTRKKHLRFARSPIHDWGLYAMERIARGEMVIEYVGEVIRAQVAEKREKTYVRQGIGSSYLFRIDEDLVVDATKKGNLGRLINHSCDPNCTAKIITISGEKKIVIYAKQDIELGDEITYDYHFPFEQDKIPCLCGSAKCRGFLN